MSNFTDLFYPKGLAITKKSLSVPAEDYEFIRQVFPEHGLSNCLTAFFFHTLATRLRELGINSYQDRVKQNYSIEQLQNLAQGNGQR